MLVALAMIFSYVESLIPINLGIPGSKLGVANLVTVTGLYILAPMEVLLVVILQWCTSPLSGHMLAQFEYRVNQNLEQHLELPDGEQEAGQ